ncbi:MAG: aminotransferase class V-fold PLP-dependent enzyme [Candidatus Woesearchaeota archaeon]
MNPEKIRNDFPVLAKHVYLDNACQSLVPQQVIAAVRSYYEEYPACGGRSMHRLGQKVSDAVDDSRKNAAKFFGAKQEEVIFTKNTTESINLVSNSIEFKGKVLQTDKEHNSCLLPFQRFGVLPVSSTSKNEFDFSAFEIALKQKPGLVAMQHASNLDGTSIPAKEVIKAAHAKDIPVLLDGAQFVPHHELNLKKLDVDFYALSSHKMMGPHLGVLYARKDWHSKLKPFMLGGGTVIESTYDSKELEPVPARFEAGLQNYASIIGFKAALDYLKNIGMNDISKQEISVTKRIWEGINGLQNLHVIGPEPEKRAGITSFYVDKIDPHQIALLLDQSADIQVRSGQHCVHSWFNKHKLQGSVRASAYAYNTLEDADKFVDALKKVVKMVR